MEEIDLKELIDMFLGRKYLIIFVLIVFAALGAIYTEKFIVPKYESTTSLILVQKINEVSSTGEDSITTADLTLNSKLVNNYKAICVSKTVLTKVIKDLNLNYTYSKLYNNVSVSSQSDAEVIKISVKDEDNQKACQIANEIAKVFVAQVEELYKVKNIEILDVAEVNYKPYNINLTKNVVIFAFVGGILVFAYILLVNMLDTTIKTDADIEKVTGLPVLASIVLNDENTKSNVSSLKKNHGQKENNIRIEKTRIESNTAGSGTISMFSYLNSEAEDDYMDNTSPDSDDTDNKKGWRK